MGAVAYESFLLKSLSDISNGVSQRWSQLELVAYESGRKESVDCNTTPNAKIQYTFLVAMEM